MMITVAVTLERIENRENVVGRDLEDTVGKEGTAPSDTQHAAQSHDGYNSFATFAILYIACIGSFETEEPPHNDNEGREGEEEDQRIIAYVDNIVDVAVCYPAP